MFDLAERGRLAMYEKGLVGLTSTKPSSEFLDHVTLSPILSDLDRRWTVPMRETLCSTIEGVPSGALAEADRYLVSLMVARPAAETALYAGALNAISGLVFVRVLEVAKPSLAMRGHKLRAGILARYEPRYLLLIAAIEASRRRKAVTARAEAPDDSIAADLAMSRGYWTKAGVFCALAKLGMKPEPESDNSKFCVLATIRLTRHVMRRVGAVPSSCDDADAFVGALFAFAFADFLT